MNYISELDNSKQNEHFLMSFYDQSTCKSKVYEVVKFL